MAGKGIQFDISSNIAQYEKEYIKLARHVTPMHYRFALNDTARDLTKILNKNTKFAFDKPNAFTQKAFGYIRSRSSQKTIESMSAWVGLKGQQFIPMTQAKPLKKGFTTSQIARTYSDIFKRLTPSGGKSIRLPNGKKYMYYPSAHSRSAGYMLANGTLNYRKINSKTSDTKKYFVGVPKGGRQGQHWNGVWHRLGVTKSKPSGEKLQMVVKLVDSQAYTKKPFTIGRYLKSNYPRLIRAHFKRQMERVKAQMRRKKMNKMIRIKQGR